MKNASEKKVLIVEDDMLLSMVEERLVKKLGYEVVAKATNGEDAIRHMHEQSPDVILMDIVLKGELDGIETMEQIRTQSDVPVIYLSGNSDRFNYERAKKTGFSDYLVKPITLHDLRVPFEKALSTEIYGAENGTESIQLGKTA
ncbi:MAG: response regulator [Balneolaceae bacterium]|nr:response regulator [Balneolaceae bacterium]